MPPSCGLPERRRRAIAAGNRRRASYRRARLRPETVPAAGGRSISRPEYPLFVEVVVPEDCANAPITRVRKHKTHLVRLRTSTYYATSEPWVARNQPNPNGQQLAVRLRQSDNVWVRSIRIERELKIGFVHPFSMLRQTQARREHPFTKPVAGVFQEGSARVPATAAARFLALAFGILVLMVLRKPDSVLNPQFWAEDGLVYYSQALADGPSSLFHAYRGAVWVLPRILAITATLLPVLWAPFLFNFLALGIDAACCALFSLPCYRHLLRSDWLRTVCCILFATALTAGQENDRHPDEHAALPGARGSGNGRAAVRKQSANIRSRNIVPTCCGRCPMRLEFSGGDCCCPTRVMADFF